jgi:hypothetical protein
VRQREVDVVTLRFYAGTARAGLDNRLTEDSP